MESRQFRNFDANSLHTDLNLAPWHLVHLEDNPNRAWEIWSRLFLEICDFHAPKRKRKVRNNYAPSLTPEIKRMMIERDKLKRVAIINNSDTHWTKYKIARSNVNANIAKAKTNYYSLTRIGPRLADNIPKTSVCFENYITPSNSSFTLNVTNCGVVYRLVNSLWVDKATGLDGISARLLKKGCPEIVLSLPI